MTSPPDHYIHQTPLVRHSLISAVMSFDPGLDPAAQRRSYAQAAAGALHALANWVQQHPDDCVLHIEITALGVMFITSPKASSPPIPTPPAASHLQDRKAVGPAEADEILGVTRQTIHALINRGQLRRFKVGRLTRIPIDDVLRCVGLHDPSQENS